MRNVTGLVLMVAIVFTAIAFSGCGSKATDGPMESAAAAPLDVPAASETPVDVAGEPGSADLAAEAEAHALADAAPPLYRAPAIDQAIATLAEPSLTELLDALADRLGKESLEGQMPMRELTMIAATSILDPQREVDAALIEQLSAGDRRALARLQAFFAQVGEALTSRGGLEESFEQAIAKLCESAAAVRELKVSNAALCTGVKGFGDFTPFERAVFLAAAPQKVIVYLEIENFSSEANQRGEHTTELSQQVAISSDRDGAVIVKEPWQSAIDVSRRKRQDYFTVQTLTLPKSLTVGSYQLQVRVRDEQTGQETHTSIPFEIVDDPKQAVSVK